MTVGLDQFEAAEPDGQVGDYLALVAEMSRQFAGSFDIQSTVRFALERIVNYLGAEAGSVFLLDKSGELLTCHACVGPVDITGIEVPASQGIVGKCVRENQPFIVRDAQADPDFSSRVDATTGFQTLSILCAPLSVSDEVLGCIELINKQGGDLFDGRDCSVLEALGAAAAMALFNARQARALVDQQRLAREIELAQEIQRGLLPSPEGSNYPVHGLNLPARLVSGDFYDYVTGDDGRITFMIADVSGKGVNAALLMAKTASVFRLLAKSGREPAEITNMLNDEVEETALRGMFVTAVIGRYDPSTARVVLVNAGHEPAIYLDADGNRKTIDAGGPPLGVLPVHGDDTTFPTFDLNITDGAVYLFTDGLTEGTLADGSRFGRERTDALVRATHHLSLPYRLSALCSPLMRRPAPLHDDITLLVIDDRVIADNRPLPELRRVSVPAEARSLRMLRSTLRDGLAMVSCVGTKQYDMVLAVDEAAQNIIRHGFGGDAPQGRIELVLRARPDMVEVDLVDTARKVDPNLICPRDLSDVQPGGLGVNIISEVMDEMVFMDRPDGRSGNLLRLRRKLT